MSINKRNIDTGELCPKARPDPAERHRYLCTASRELERAAEDRS